MRISEIILENRQFDPLSEINEAYESFASQAVMLRAISLGIKNSPEVTSSPTINQELDVMRKFFPMLLLDFNKKIDEYIKQIQSSNSISGEQYIRMFNELKSRAAGEPMDDDLNEASNGSMSAMPGKTYTQPKKKQGNC